MTKLYVLLAFLMLAAYLPTPAAAELPFTIYGGAGFGKAMNDGAPGGGLGLGGGIVYQFENSPFAIGGDLGYIMLGKEDWGGTFGGAEASAEITWSAIPFTAQGYYMIPVSGSVAPYLEAGAGFYNTRAKWKYSASYEGISIGQDETDSSTDMGINLGGGLKFGNPDAKMRFGADARYHIIMTEGESTGMVTVFGRVYFE